MLYACYVFPMSINHHRTECSQIRCSLAGQDTRLSPERPGFESRQRRLFYNFLFVLLAIKIPHEAPMTFKFISKNTLFKIIIWFWKTLVTFHKTKIGKLKMKG